MFIRTCIRRKGNKTYTYRYPVMSVRVSGKRHPVQVHLGAGGEKKEGWLKRQLKPEPGMYLGLKMEAESKKFAEEKAAKEKAEAPKENAPANEGKEATPSSETSPS